MSTINPLQIVISHGQSLAIGAESGTPVSTRALFPSAVLTTSTSTTGEAIFVDLVATERETPLVSMLNTIAQRYSDEGLAAPTLVGASTGSPGKPLVSLYLSSSDKYLDIHSAMAETSQGDIFYTPSTNSGEFLIYLNSNGHASLIKTTNYEPNQFDKVIESLHSIAAAAQDADYTLAESIVLTLIQGASDTSGYPGKSYADQLDMLVNRVRSASTEILGQEMEVVTVIRQGGTAYAARQQLTYVANTDQTYLGSFTQYGRIFPSSHDWLSGATSSNPTSHLNSIGYNLLGQEMGNLAYEALSGKLAEDSFLKFDSVILRGNKITLTVSGLHGEITEDLEASSVPNLGFQLRDAGNARIIDAQISSRDTITLTLSEYVTSAFTIHYGSWGSIKEKVLHDSTTTLALNPFGISALSNVEMRNYVPSLACPDRVVRRQS